MMKNTALLLGAPILACAADSHGNPSGGSV
jgi:hypothetical protein